MKKLFLFILLISFNNSCSLIDDSPCGVYENFELYRLGQALFDTAGGKFHTFLRDTNRIFQYADLIENICPDEAVNSSFRVALEDEKTNGITASGRVTWLLIYKDEFLMGKSGSDLKGTGKTSLKHDFGMDPAWCIPTVEFSFPTKGSYQQDSLFLNDNVVSAEIMVNYRKL
ncbi:MAG TPA: hypothetical protein VK590_09305 [Saprospiraceae bacterium]|nr:hypothetical protein [Saprospiraceae bacterium]